MVRGARVGKYPFCSHHSKDQFNRNHPRMLNPEGNLDEEKDICKDLKCLPIDCRERERKRMMKQMDKVLRVVESG